MRKIANLNRFSMLKDYKFSVEHILVQTIRNKTGQCPVAHHPVLRLRLVQTNFIPEITSLLLLLIGRLDFTPCGGKFTSSTDMPFQADATGQRLTVPIEGYVFNLVVVYDVWLRSCIRVGIELLL